MEIFLTIVTGVSVFVLGQITLKLIIDPTQKLRETIAEVLFHLANDYRVIHGAQIVDKEKIDAVSESLRNLGSRLFSNQHLILWYWIPKIIFSLPTKDNIRKASELILKIPNHIHGEEHDRLDLYSLQVCELLNVNNPINNGISKHELEDSIKNRRNTNV